MIGLLLLLHILILFTTYRLFNKEIISPSFLFISGFTISCYVAYCYQTEWDLGLHFNTFSIILLGSLSFLLVEWWYRNKHKKYFCYRNIKISQDVVPLSANKLIAFAVFQLIIYYLHYKQQMSFANTSVWADAIGEIDQDNKFGDKSFSLPWYINVPHAFCQVSGYIWICLFVYYIKLKRFTKTKILLAINVLLSMMGSLLSGGRMPLFGYLIPLGIMLFALNKKRSQKKQKPIKQQLGLIFLGVLFILFFSQIGSIIGRHETDNMDAKYVFAVYCGAEIKNLDVYINSNEPFHLNEVLPLSNTFKYFYDFFNARLGVGIPFKEEEYAFLTNGKYFLGNVYTCYRSFYNDLGGWGFILAGFCSLLACVLYGRFNKSSFFQTGIVDLNVFLYCFFSMGLFLAFFSELFLRRLLSVEYFIRTIIYFYIITFILYGKNRVKVLS